MTEKEKLPIKEILDNFHAVMIGIMADIFGIKINGRKTKESPVFNVDNLNDAIQRGSHVYKDFVDGVERGDITIDDIIRHGKKLNLSDLDIRSRESSIAEISSQQFKTSIVNSFDIKR